MHLETPIVTRRGRNERLILQRNRSLVARFYYYSTLMQLKFSAVLELLENEFFISQSRITDLLADNTELITSLELKKTTTTDLKEAYPFMNWHYNHNRMLRNGEQMSLNLF